MTEILICNATTWYANTKSILYADNLAVVFLKMVVRFGWVLLNTYVSGKKGRNLILLN